MLIVFSADDYNRIVATEALSELALTKATIPTDLVETLEMLLFHGDAYITSNSQMEEVMRSLLSDGLSQQIEKLNDRYFDVYDQEMATAKIYQLALIAVMFLMLVIILYVLLRQYL